MPLDRFAFASGYTLLFGGETAWTSEMVHAAADAPGVVIPTRPGGRSPNLSVSPEIRLFEEPIQMGGL